ncbi:MAG: hypothetical protein JWR10_3470 [Rubritepida sp.]|nr:hypothetical protein [Rubritepida sp.]
MNMTIAGRLGILCIGLGLPAGAMAQGSTPRSPATGQTAAATAAPAAAASPGRRSREMTPEQMAQQVERHLTQLHAQLAITAAQQPQWDQFAKVTRDNATELQQRFQQRGTQFARMNAAENMADFAQISELHAQELMRLAAAFRDLYATMSPEQKQGADAVFRTGQPPSARTRG